MDAHVEKNIEVVAKAIKFKEVVSFVYDNEKIRVEPFILGTHKGTNGYAFWGYHSHAHEAKDNPANWKLYDLDKMTETRLTAVRIKDTRHGYTGKHSEIAKVIISI